MNKILEIRNLYKNYGRKGYETPVLQDISMDIFEGDFIAIMGPSGAGKTTLLNLLSTLDKPQREKFFWKERTLQNCPTSSFLLSEEIKSGLSFRSIICWII